MGKDSTPLQKELKKSKLHDDHIKKTGLIIIGRRCVKDIDLLLGDLTFREHNKGTDELAKILRTVRTREARLMMTLESTSCLPTETLLC